MTYSVLKYIKELIENDVEEKKAEYDAAVKENSRFAKKIQEAIRDHELIFGLPEKEMSPIYTVHTNGLITQMSFDEIKKKLNEFESNMKNKEIDLRVANSVRDSFLNTDWTEK